MLVTMAAICLCSHASDLVNMYTILTSMVNGLLEQGCTCFYG